MVVNLDLSIVPVRDRNGVTIIDKERVIERWVGYFQNVLNRNTVKGKDIEDKESL